MNSENKTKTRAITYIALFVLLFSGYLLLRNSTWQGSKQLHTLMELTATILALFVGISALVRFYTKKNITFLLIGTGFLGTAFLDGYHTAVTSSFFDMYFPSPPPSLIPWSWIASRLFLSVLLFLSWWAWTREKKLQKPLIKEKNVFLIVGVLTLLSFAFFAFVPLPRAYYPGITSHRPEEYVPAFFFLLALIGYLRKGYWKKDNFEHWLVMSIIVGFMGQAMFMSYSGQLFDMMFDSAHLLKKVSYIFVLIGLLISMYEIFIQAEESASEIMKINQKLKNEIAERKQIEKSRRKTIFYLDNVRDTMIVINSRKEIIEVNKEFSKLWGYSQEEVIGESIFKLFPKEDIPIHQYEMEKAISVKKPRNFEITALTKYGEKVPMSIRGSAIFDNDGKVEEFIGVFRDITENKLAEEKIQLQLKRFNVLRFMEMTITASLDLKVTLDILLIQVTTQLNIDAASILLLNRQTQTLQHVASKGFRSDALKYTKLKLGESNAGRAAKEQCIINISNLKENIDGFARSKLFTDEDFITYIAIPLIAKGEVEGVLELFHRAPLSAEQDWLEFLENIANQAAIAIDNATLFNELTSAYDTTIEGWSRAMDLRDKETEGHTQRVTEMTLHVAREIGLKDEELIHIKRGALLHDMGKMGVPDSVLLKPGRLTEEEWVIMRKHPVYAYDMLYPIEYLRRALDIPYCHHEKWDGTGYPRGLKNEEIPISARIFAVVDVWDALCSDRPYRPAWPKEKVYEHIQSLAGTHFDPKVVEVFLKKLSTKMERINEERYEITS